MIHCIRIILAFVVFPLHFNFSTHAPSGPKAILGKEPSLINFEAISDGNKVIVNWTADSEINFDYYTVEKSKDGVNFYQALMIKSAGKLANHFEYTDIDYSPFSGISYYRLRQNDYFGEYAYSSVIVVNCQVLKDGTVLPLNANAGIQTELSAMQGKPVLVVVRDTKGSEFISKIVVTLQDGKLLASDLKHELIAGEYFVVASSCNPLYHQKVSVK